MPARASRTAIALIVALSLVACEDAATKAKRDADMEDFALIKFHEDRVGASLREPSSAEFRNVKVYRSVLPVVCGEVNGKNGFGGYAGYQRFVSGGVVAVESGMKAGEMTKLWDHLCH
jgi:hypothetical protein